VQELLDVVTRVDDIVFAQILRPLGPEKGTGLSCRMFSISCRAASTGFRPARSPHSEVNVSPRMAVPRQGFIAIF
jgi:hypothetical protein